MTGKKTGVGVQLKEQINPYLIQIHCVAHRLALVTSQAASKDNVPYLKTYQDFLCNIFYWFKHSALRTASLSSLQEVLDSPQIKIKEVHSVRWFSFYNALDAIFRSWAPLATLLEQEATKDAKAKGYFKILTTSQFILISHILMDIIPIVTHLNVLFQKQNLDLSVVDPAVKSVREELKRLKVEQGKFELDAVTALQDKATHFKDIKITDNAKLRESAFSTKIRFIDNILENLDTRFPDDVQSLVSAFSVLGVRGLRFVSQDDLQSYGTEKIMTLFEQYKASDYIAHESGILRQEWSCLKKLIIEQQYGYSKMGELWQIISDFHSDTFPNLLKLANIGLALTVHTSDVERGFSAQNLVKTNMRNRISSQKVEQVITVKLNGPELSEFDYSRALKKFREMKKRVLP